MSNNIPPIKIAFVIDGIVVDVIHTDDRLASILLSSPTILDVTEQYGNESMTGWTYDGVNLTRPQVIIE